MVLRIDVHITVTNVTHDGKEQFTHIIGPALDGIAHDNYATHIDTGMPHTNGIRHKNIIDSSGPPALTESSKP